MSTTKDSNSFCYKNKNVRCSFFACLRDRKIIFIRDLKLGFCGSRLGRQARFCTANAFSLTIYDVVNIATVFRVYLNINFYFFGSWLNKDKQKRRVKTFSTQQFTAGCRKEFYGQLPRWLWVRLHHDMDYQLE